MKRSQFSEEQIAYALRQADPRTPVTDVCRQIGVSELRRLRQVEDENRRLKQLVADLTLDKQMRSEALRRVTDADSPPGAGRVVPSYLSGQHRAGVSATVGPSATPRGPADAYPGDRPRTLMTCCVAMGGWSISTSAVLAGGAAGARAHSSAQGPGPPPLVLAGTRGAAGSVEHGFRT